PDGSGLALLREAREREVHAPALIITGLRDNALAHAAFELCATYLVKPVEDVYVESLLHHAWQRRLDGHSGKRVQNVLANWSARFGLTNAEASVLLLATDGHDRAAIAAIRGSTEATAKNQIYSLLQKTGYSCLRQAVALLLREALAAEVTYRPQGLLSAAVRPPTRDLGRTTLKPTT